MNRIHQTISEIYDVYKCIYLEIYLFLEYLLSPSTGAAKDERKLQESYFPVDYQNFQVITSRDWDLVFYPTDPDPFNRDPLKRAKEL